jgi:hypothetical protein
MSVAAYSNREEMIRRLRVGNLRKLFRARYGPVLPDDDAGREDLRELLLPISVGPHAGIKMPNAIEIWAPWMQPEEAGRLIDQINLTPARQRRPTASNLGERLYLTNGERERLKLWTIAAHDLDQHQSQEHRKAKRRARDRRRRLLRGRKPRAEYEGNSANRAKPWELEGISRRTYYRRRKTAVAQVCVQVRLTKAERTLVPREKSQKPRKELSEGSDTLNGQHSTRRLENLRGLKEECSLRRNRPRER